MEHTTVRVPMSSAGASCSAVAISLMKLAQSPMTTINEINWQARITLKVTPMAPSWGAWNRIVRGAAEPKSVMSSREGRSLLAVRRGNRGLGNGTVGGGGKEVLAEMVGNGFGVAMEVMLVLHTVA